MKCSGAMKRQKHRKNTIIVSVETCVTQKATIIKYATPKITPRIHISRLDELWLPFKLPVDNVRGNNTS